MSQFGRVAAYLSSPYWCVQCTVQVSPYWCVYSAQCRSVLIGVCTVHNAGQSLLVCVQCTVRVSPY